MLSSREYLLFKTWFVVGPHLALVLYMSGVYLSPGLFECHCTKKAKAWNLLSSWP